MNNYKKCSSEMLIACMIPLEVEKAPVYENCVVLL